jgi:DNA polymerase-3 subunit chi
MTAISFYHLTSTPMQRALPKLLEKIVGGGHRALVVASTEEEAEQLNQLLWTYDQDSFLAHGSLKDGRAEDQPILLSAEATPRNNATMLLMTNGQVPDAPERFERVLDMFDGNNAEAVAAARTRWTAYKNAGHTLTYQQQTPNGGWEKKA